MTIGEKITKLRIEKNISQEALAEMVNVSRQSVSKWEVDASLPQIDKAIQLCEIFNISADDLLKEDNAIPQSILKEKNKYFKTDGFRGEVNKTLTSNHAYLIGRFLGWYFQIKKTQKPKILIGKDTRRSSYMLESSLVSGITASGGDCYMLHVTTTPSVSYITKQDEFDCGIMITASHNPYYDNGIKLINKFGEKLDDETCEMIEQYIDGNLNYLNIFSNDLPLAEKDKIGSVIDYASGRNRYIGYLISLASHSYKELRIGLDCANGSSWMIAKSVFSALGAKVYTISDEPDGLNINKNCGSTHIENLCNFVKENHLDVGFAFDGDADRCIAVDEKGNVTDGDAILYILAKRLEKYGNLNDKMVVATVMSNSGLVKSLENIGFNCTQTSVGDRYVYEKMLNNDYALGGEQSGHIIIKKYATTGDGILTAIMLTEEMCDRKLPLSNLSEGLYIYPQYTKNIPVSDQDAVLGDAEVKSAIKKITDEIGDNGRVLIRKSGTEPVIRIMIEYENYDKCISFANEIAEVITKRRL